MPSRENGKSRYFIYDLSTALEELRFTRAFGPGILAALFYGVVSGSMSFVNKVGKGIAISISSMLGLGTIQVLFILQQIFLLSFCR